ncbi:undecaprenyl-diphosphatase UppP [Candidatus Kuenenbacteria bacterium]|nr:undecaprenyl-diphosphatase UppP [Candidatus Kuenenbacteria bacterium]
MLYIYSLILGIVQGITEFVPVSSSGHLVVLHDIINFNVVDSLAFDVALHLGTVLAVIIFFRIEILRYIVAILEIFIPKRKVNRQDLSEVLLIIYATIPAAIIGFLFEDAIKKLFRNTITVIITLVLGAMLFFLVEKYAKHYKNFSGMGIGRALYIGLAQALALIPGVSRSGITIVAGMSVKLKRSEAARFSFLLSAPIILGAGVLKLREIEWSLLPAEEIGMFIIGFISSFIVGFFVIKYFLKFLQHHNLNVFGWYRIGLALLLSAWLIF